MTRDRADRCLASKALVPAVTTELIRSDFEALRALRIRLQQTRLSERARLARELDRMFSRRQRGADFDTALLALVGQIDASTAKVDALKSLPLNFEYDASLPIVAHRDEILAALVKHQVVVLCGATGSGKTTQLPKFCLEAGRGAFGLIGHTQPRRIAARAIASRLAQELGTTVGGAVGYQVRFTDRSGPDARVKLMTDGILLKELESDALLERYDTIIIDEAHERSLNIDLLLGVLKGVLDKRADLKLIVTSATIDPEKFATFFRGAPVIEVSGRSYPVEVRYRPLAGDDEDATELSLPEGVVAAIQELDRDGRGDALVFLPGEKQIRECSDALTRAKIPGTEILPLFSRLSTRDQERIFEGHAQRRVVLATNVAETSLTVPGIRNVIDSGLARISRYSVRGKVQRLPIERISKASADQRKGRCGREADGICIRLFAEEDFEAREEFTPPEVLRTNLASVILRLAVLGLGEPENFPFIDPPDTRSINDGYRLLQELKAVDADRRVTSLGRQVASLPVDPRLARMLIAASHHACLAEMLIVASFLEIQDPRERPADAQTQADQAHAEFADPRSDFVAILNVWKAYQEKSGALSGSQLRKWCREHFLSFVRMREWQELHRQLDEAVDDIGLRANQVAADYAGIHQAILTGFLGSIGQLDERREYLGARGTRFIIAPGTPLSTKPPKWVVAGSIVETTKIFARMVASIEPQWIEAAGAHLLKRSYAEPHWVEQRGFVSAFESLSLYGLTLAAQRRVNYGSVAPKEAREIFVREALVEGHSSLRADFLKHNAQLRADVERMEAMIRRRDILVDEQAVCDFYLARLPEHINSVAAMEKWLKEKARAARAIGDAAKTQDLRMSLSDLMRRSVTEITRDQYPESLTVAGNRLALEYNFEPSTASDGATLIVPAPLLKTIAPDQLRWAVPGWRLETITEILRALPKEQRKHLVPIPDAATRCDREIATATEKTDALAAWIARESGVPISPEQVRKIGLSDHLQLNIRAVELDGRMIAEGRDLGVLRRAIGKSSARESNSPSSTQATIHREWDFGDLPVERTVESGGVKFTVYPALLAMTDGVKIVELGTLSEAESTTRHGLIRLAMLALPQQAKLARQQFNSDKDLVLLGQGLATDRPLADSAVEKIFLNCFLAGADALPRSREEFTRLLDAHRADFGGAASEVTATLRRLLEGARAVRQSVKKLTGAQFKSATDDAQTQLLALLSDDFVVKTPSPWFDHLPRYLQAIVRRLDRLPANLKRDAELSAKVGSFAKAYAALKKEAVGGVHPELDRLRWLIEEYRVSLFAQDLKTAVSVSDKRLTEQVERVRAEIAA